MDIAEKHRIAERILQIDDDMLLSEVEALIGMVDRDYGLTLPKEILQTIDLSRAQLAAGEGIPHQQVMAEMRSRFLKK